VRETSKDSPGSISSTTPSSQVQKHPTASKSKSIMHHPRFHFQIDPWHPLPRKARPRLRAALIRHHFHQRQRIDKRSTDSSEHADSKSRFVRAEKFCAECAERQSVFGEYKHRYTDNPREKHKIISTANKQHVIDDENQLLALKEDSRHSDDNRRLTEPWIILEALTNHTSRNLPAISSRNSNQGTQNIVRSTIAPPTGHVFRPLSAALKTI